MTTTQALDARDAAALLQGGMRPGELRVLIKNELTLQQYTRLNAAELAILKLSRVTPLFVEADGVELLLKSDPRYPSALQTVASAPEVLYVRGSLDALALGIGAVGTRQITSIGQNVARFAAVAAQAAGAPLVSGLARGCDIAAHKAANELGVPSVAVLACGVDQVYPSEHADTLELLLAQGGAVVSEQPFGTQVNPGRLMARNRIIIGLSAAVIPCEAPRGSRGTVQAVGTAFREGRFVIVARVKPSWRSQPGAWLSERLIRADINWAELGWDPARVGSGAHGVADTAGDLTEMVRFAVLFASA